MDLALTAEQVDLQSAVREMLRRVASDDVLTKQQSQPTGYISTVWKAMSEGGWLGLHIPEEYGGAGAAPMDVAVMLEEWGRGPLPLLFVLSSVIAPAFIAEVATDSQKSAILPTIASGERRFTLALTEREMGVDRSDIGSTITADESGFALNGTKPFVTDGFGSTHALVAARSDVDDRIRLLVIDLARPGVAMRATEGLVSWQSVIQFTNVHVKADEILGPLGGDAWEGIHRTTLRTIPLLAAYQVGSCASVFDMTLEHSRNRIQFGQPIGRFSRVQDHVIELVNQLDAARWACYEAVWKLENDLPLDAAVHMTKSIVAGAHWAACDAAHEVHAGLGADLQYGLAKHTMLARTLYHFLGSPSWHRDRMIDALGWVDSDYP